MVAGIKSAEKMVSTNSSIVTIVSPSELRVNEDVLSRRNGRPDPPPGIFAAEELDYIVQTCEGVRTIKSDEQPESSQRKVVWSSMHRSGESRQ